MLSPERSSQGHLREPSTEEVPPACEELRRDGGYLSGAKIKLRCAPRLCCHRRGGRPPPGARRGRSTRRAVPVLAVEEPPPLARRRVTAVADLPQLAHGTPYRVPFVSEGQSEGVILTLLLSPY